MIIYLHFSDPTVTNGPVTKNNQEEKLMLSIIVFKRKDIDRDYFKK